MTKKELDDLLGEEKQLYFGIQNSNYKQMKRQKHKRYYIWKYLYYFRLCQYYMAKRTGIENGSFERRIAKYLFRFYEKRKNEYSYKSGVEIGIKSKLGRNCDIWHSGVVINGTIGDNCIFHGNNTIGNKGKGKENQCPTLGSNIDVGVGAVVIGKVRIADNVIIGACSLVAKDFLEPNCTIIGVPGRQLLKKNES